MDNEKEHTIAAQGIDRRTVVKGAAWSVPVVAMATVAPRAAASGAPVVNPGATTPTVAGACQTVSDFTFTVTEDGAPVAGQAVVVTLPTDFKWADDTTAPKTFTTNASGQVNVTGVQAGTGPGTFMITAQIVAPGGDSTSIPVTVPGLWIGSLVGTSGGQLHSIYLTAPADPSNPGTPDGYAYCIEHKITAKTRITGQTGGFATYLGSNYFGQPGIADKVLWVMAHGYPALSLADFGTAAGAPGLSLNDATEAMQYAIWRYTDLTWDASWDFTNSNVATAYWYLVNGANASTQTGGTGTVISVPKNACEIPTESNHAQTLMLVPTP